MKDSTPDTQDHIAEVQYNIELFNEYMRIRGLFHDQSKLFEPEKSGYDALVTNLADVEYGTDAYRAALDAAKPIIQHHYERNSHHPEHYDNGINGMTLMDVVEMLCDWKAASQRTKQGSIEKSLTHNKTRFNMSDQLYDIFVNTVRELGW